MPNAKKKFNQLNKTNFIKVANCIIKVSNFDKTKVKQYLKDFLISSSSRYDYFIKFINKSFLDKVCYEKKAYSLPQKINIYVFQYLLRNILQDFFGRTKNSFFLHCSGVSIGNDVYLFLGPQGSGKSTLSKILNDIVPAVADDSGIIVKENNKFYFYQTPFIEKNQFTKTIKRFHIRKIFFIKKSKYCKEKKILDKKEILDLFIKQLWTDKKRLYIQLKILMEFVNYFDQFYWFDFPKNKEEVINWFKKFNKE